MKNLPKVYNCILELDQEWLTIWFNIPEKRNALSDELLNDLLLVFKSIKNNESIRGVIFRGKNGIFCSGADLKFLRVLARNENEAYEKSLMMSRKLGEVFKELSQLSQITVSAVEGPAMAGAFGILCASDIVITMNNAKFAMTETKLGLSPAQIAPYVLRRLHFSEAKKMMLLGFSIDGSKAHSIGLADYIADSKEEFVSTLNSIKEKIRKCAPRALGLTKEILYSKRNIDSEQAAQIFADCITGEEGQEGIRSFFEKTPPEWADRK